MAVQSLKPRIDMMKARYGDDKNKIQRETNILYEQAGVNPLAGCLPSIATIPIFIGLYRSLMAASNEGLFEEGTYPVDSTLVVVPHQFRIGCMSLRHTAYLVDSWQPV